MPPSPTTRSTGYVPESARLTVATSMAPVGVVRGGTPGSVGVARPQCMQNCASSGRGVLQAGQVLSVSGIAWGEKRDAAYNVGCAVGWAKLLRRARRREQARGERQRLHPSFRAK